MTWATVTVARASSQVVSDEDGKYELGDFQTLFHSAQQATVSHIRCQSIVLETMFAVMECIRWSGLAIA